MATMSSILEMVKFERTPRDKGWHMVLDVVKYDGGSAVYVNTRPSDTLLDANVNIAMALTAFDQWNQWIKKQEAVTK